ncbi:MAG: hypothetical protein GWN31_01085 [Candidatus Thorarchaeota archaeon]|nr:hypothetical protein [Candidatus Thorarchaeota archaeon]NIW12539.1 hypothetical protein [Candidatus Thorarchaeota archaeon]
MFERFFVFTVLLYGFFNFSAIYYGFYSANNYIYYHIGFMFVMCFEAVMVIGLRRREFKRTLDDTIRAYKREERNLR